MPFTMYGRKNCDTVKEWRAWLEARGMPYEFHDYKAAGAYRARPEIRCKGLGWDLDGCRVAGCKPGPFQGAVRAGRCK